MIARERGGITMVRGICGALLLLGCAGCAFIQPTSRGAPIADTVGAIIFTSAATIDVAAYQKGNSSPSGFQSYEDGVFVLAGLAALYALSALYGFSQDAKTQNSDEPILGLVILSLGLAGFANGANGSSQGCCSHHGGMTDQCDGGKMVCADGQDSLSCACR